MNDHRFDILTQHCLGCDIAASEVREQAADRRRKPPSCPATFEVINDAEAGTFEVISGPDRLVIRKDGATVLKLGNDAARALIFAVGGSC